MDDKPKQKEYLLGKEEEHEHENEAYKNGDEEEEVEVEEEEEEIEEEEENEPMCERCLLFVQNSFCTVCAQEQEESVLIPASLHPCSDYSGFGCSDCLLETVW